MTIQPTNTDYVAHYSGCTEWAPPTTHPTDHYGPPKGEKKAKGDQGRLVDVGDGHQLWVQEYGNPNGEPVIYLHGGPGGGCVGIEPGFFDPKRYRIILFDQRGCGHSQPTLKQDFKAAFEGNNTANLVEDINVIRDQLGIRGKMHIAGGSWGTTLGLAYCIKNPEKVKSAKFRGMFLGTDAGMKYLFQGNAANYTELNEPSRKVLDELEQQAAEASENEAARKKAATDKGETYNEPETLAEFDSNKLAALRQANREMVDHFNAQSAEQEGAYRAYVPPYMEGKIPEKYWPQHQHMAQAYARSWDEYVRVIPREERGNMPKAYVARLEANADENLRGTGQYNAETNTIDPDYQQRVAFAFAKWEGIISKFCYMPDPKTGSIDLGEFADPDFAIIFARTEARYMVDGLYLTPDGSPSPGGSDYLTQQENLETMANNNIHVSIVHGAQDQVCPVRDAHAFQRAYEAVGGKVELDIPQETGHSGGEMGNVLGIKAFGDADGHIITAAERLGAERKGTEHVLGQQQQWVRK